MCNNASSCQKSRIYAGARFVYSVTVYTWRVNVSALPSGAICATTPLSAMIRQHIKSNLPATEKIRPTGLV
uniref:Uncharacterized protein n=1 Tax=Ralstonia solanacearum TaxID=305 RepID=A0A0S4TUS9_RALSL|nr:protein of unknown function [Ralstonia solanacearum]